MPSLIAAGTFETFAQTFGFPKITLIQAKYVLRRMSCCAKFIKYDRVATDEEALNLIIWYKVSVISTVAAFGYGILYCVYFQWIPHLELVFRGLLVAIVVVDKAICIFVAIKYRLNA